MTFIERPISLTCILLALALMFYPVVTGMIGRMRRRAA